MSIKINTTESNNSDYGSHKTIISVTGYVGLERLIIELIKENYVKSKLNLANSDFVVKSEEISYINENNSKGSWHVLSIYHNRYNQRQIDELVPDIMLFDKKLAYVAVDLRNFINQGFVSTVGIKVSEIYKFIETTYLVNSEVELLNKVCETNERSNIKNNKNI